MIGSLGNIVFKVSTDQIRTFQELTRSASARTTRHELIGRKPKLEFLGPGLETISLKLSFSLVDNVDPKEEVKKLTQMRDRGEALVFMLGNEPQGEDRWLVTDVKEIYRHVDIHGYPQRIDADVTLQEYVSNTRR